MTGTDPLLRGAAFAGAHALALFGGALVLVLIGVVLGWRVVERRNRRRAASAGTAPTATWLVTGFALIAGGAAVFAALAGQLGTRAALGRADEALADALQRSVPSGALHAFAWLTDLGDPRALAALGVVVGGVLLWRGERVLLLGWVAALAGNGLLNTTLKQVFERARPIHDGGPVTADGFSFPSGHSSGSLVTYGMLAYLGLRLLPPRWHLPAALGAATLALAVGASRVFLRVHFASDVLAGFASGAAWLALCIVGVELARRRKAAAERFE